MFAMCDACLISVIHKIYEIQNLCMGKEKFIEVGYKEVF
jgi:hypothetical protein